jgi:starch phosphorylase
MNIRTFTVLPTLPKRLSPLMRIARNIHWTWNHEAVKLFQRLDLDLWETCNHSPIQMLGEMSQEKFEELLQDESFLAHMDNVAIELDDYMQTGLWFDRYHSDEKDLNLCYFSMEFGFHESLPVYSGGLGILAGDHLKSASDLGVPLIGIGLLYRKGYFRQYLNAEGWQQERFPDNDVAQMPIELVKEEGGKPLVFSIDYPGRQVFVQIWKLNVGRVRLFLLDTNLEQNSREDRGITETLYGGDLEMRMQQEILLGIGGIKAILAMNIYPNVCHMNEGHSAFLALERIRYFMLENDLSFAEAAEIISASNVFTTHTPVPAGNDMFPTDLVDHYFRPFYADLKLNREQFMGLGRQNPFDKNEPFCMTVLALRLAAHANGVSRLHGKVSRSMWSRIWPGLQVDELPIGYITNGVHATGWVSHEMSDLFNRYLGPRWRTNSQEERAWERIDSIPDSELWRTHERRRERLVAFARARLETQLKARGVLLSEIARARDVLDPEALTLGFARRFAAYKRGDLLFTDPDRMERILNNKEHPVQIIYAGKAHPKDNLGKEIIKKIVQFAREPRFRDRVVFIEDYDINVAHAMVQGVDVWINNPRRPLEASGTSGMKVAMNGGINVSVLDGWWDEAYDGRNGWAIGAGEEYDDHAYQDIIEARTLYNILEKEVIPTFYQRGSDGVPRNWLDMMKHSLKTCAPVFNTNRQVLDYLEKYYLPGSKARIKLMKDNFRAARELAAWKNSIRRRWGQMSIEQIETDDNSDPHAGDNLPVRVFTRLGEVDPKEIKVEVYYGQLDTMGEIRTGQTLSLEMTEALGDGRYMFSGAIPLSRAGRFGFDVRLLPYHPDMIQRFEPGLIYWA